MKTMKKVIAVLIVVITVFSTSIIAFAASEFTISFNANGGSGSMSNQKVTYGTVTRVNANQFKRSGYIFRGWNVQREDGTWNTEKLHGGDEGWRKDIPNGYHKTLYKNSEKVAKTAPAGTKVTFYAVWEGPNDKFSTFNRVNIQETTKVFNDKTNPMYKSDNQFWVINSKAAYPGFSTKSTGVYVGAIALAIIDNMLNGKYDKTFNKYHDGDKTLFSSIGYTYSPNFASYQAFVQAIYDHITRGYPVPIKVSNGEKLKNGEPKPIYAVAYGVLSNKGSRPTGKIIAHDIAVIDANDGEWKRLDELYKYTPSGKYEMGIACWDPSNFYTLGEETYGFKNFSGKYTDDKGNVHPNKCVNKNCTNRGHCFGMSVTSDGYYHHFLDLPAGNVHALPDNSTTKKTICYYQSIQGSIKANSVVAGTLSDENSVKADWNDIVNYVKSGYYNYKGRFVISLRVKGEGGHAVNFLSYKKENGQDHIYVYDNNFPDKSVYLYLGNDNKIHESPYSTFEVDVDESVYLIDTFVYFNLARGYDPTHVIYAKEGTISVEGAEAYKMCMGDEGEEYIMYEIPEETSNVKIKILDKKNWEFEHNGITYSKEDCYGSSQFILSLLSYDDTEDAGFFVKPDGPFGWIKIILYKLFGWMSS